MLFVKITRIILCLFTQGGEQVPLSKTPFIFCFHYFICQMCWKHYQCLFHELLLSLLEVLIIEIMKKIAVVLMFNNIIEQSCFNITNYRDARSNQLFICLCIKSNVCACLMLCSLEIFKRREGNEL